MNLTRHVLSLSSKVKDQVRENLGKVILRGEKLEDLNEKGGKGVYIQCTLLTLLYLSNTAKNLLFFDFDINLSASLVMYILQEEYPWAVW